ncbi:hypothetical protein EC523_11490 [Avibacterium paragallinarum]|nr:hypothetical protein EC523_11490 [Avibacterium paragallinarum]
MGVFGDKSSDFLVFSNGLIHNAVFTFGRVFSPALCTCVCLSLAVEIEIHCGTFAVFITHK